MACIAENAPRFCREKSFRLRLRIRLALCLCDRTRSNTRYRIDISEKMLEEAQKRNPSPLIEYQCMAIEDFDFQPDTYDIVISSLTFHYLESFTDICRKINNCLTPEAPSSSPQNIRYLQPMAIRNGITTKTGSLSIGRQIAILRKASAQQSFWAKRLSNTTKR